jgi:SAM-dependent methyltransferase
MSSTPWWHDLIAAEAEPRFDGGIWRLHPQDADHFFAEYLPAELVHQLLRSARTAGWRPAVEDLLQRLPPDVAAYTRDYFLASYRARFVEALDVSPGSTVLDLACGWGFASQRCLESGALVVGTETSIGRLEFCSLRFSQQGFGDRFVGVEMDANRPFPFEPASFDAVIVSGLMEWLPSTARGSPESIQQVFLERCAAVLRPGGRLYLAIENRWWWRYFFGARDLHRIHRLQVLTSILPRRLARAWAILVTGEDYRTYTYSFFDYLRLLRKAGFQTVDADYPRPDYVQPKRVQPLCRGLRLSGDRKELASELRTQGAPGRLIVFGRSFAFIARK